jgi:hypothetical protein
MKLSVLFFALLTFSACGPTTSAEVTVETDSTEVNVVSEIADCCDTLEVDTPAVAADSAL